MSDLIERNVIPFGPGKIVRGSDTLYSAGDINVLETKVWAVVNPDQWGPGIKMLVDHIMEVSFKPQSIWANLSKVYPTALIAPTIMGQRICTGTPVPLAIHDHHAPDARSKEDDHPSQ